MDIWLYILQEGIEIPSLYFAHNRDVFNRDGVWMAAEDVILRKDSEVVENKVIRFRTIGDMTWHWCCAF